jgi:ABC-type multidrug transport system ATPase subunit
LAVESNSLTLVTTYNNMYLFFGRMTLLLGPPGAGKTTLLLALAGKLSKSLKVSGRVTYNGHDMHEFVPQRTAAYISQQDLQLGELTVRETLDFSGRCQGVGTRSGECQSQFCCKSTINKGS